MAMPRAVLILVAMLSCVVLTGCLRGDEYSGADDRALCDPSTGAAFLVKPGGMDISFVKRAPHFDHLCKKGGAA